jgi:hypothetical protein
MNRHARDSFGKTTSMKAFLRSFFLIAALLLGGASLALAQQVSTGVIQGFQPKEGTLTIRSDQTQGLITFFGVDKSNIFTADGKISTLADLPLGSRVTVQFTERDKQWFVSKVILPPANPPGAKTPLQQGLVINAEPLDSRASINARDGDITTNADVKKPRVEPLRRR